jgi:hypothetical protein
MTWIAVAVGGGALVSGLGSFFGGKQQANAANNAQAISLSEFNRIQQQESPWMHSGNAAQSLLNNYLGLGPKTDASTYGSLLRPFNTSDWQSLSPAYQFQRQQGMQGTLNGNANSAGALSGSAQKDLMDYNQNLANTSFNNAFNMYQTQQGNIYQRLAGISQLGQSAASATGQQGTALAGQAAQSAQNYGTAMGGAISGAAGSVGSAASALPWLFANNSPAPNAASGASYIGPG